VVSLAGDDGESESQEALRMRSPEQDTLLGTSKFGGAANDSFDEAFDKDDDNSTVAAKPKRPQWG